VFIVVSVYFVIDSVRKLLDTPSYITLSETKSIFSKVLMSSLPAARQALLYRMTGGD
jgi:hypothetical protein